MTKQGGEQDRREKRREDEKKYRDEIKWVGRIGQDRIVVNLMDENFSKIEFTAMSVTFIVTT